MADLVKLHTSEVFHGQEPAATALRVAGVPRAKVLIAIDSIVPVTNDKRRIMPEHAWDWSMMISWA
jgi:hypothetical protein